MANPTKTTHENPKPTLAADAPDARTNLGGTHTEVGFDAATDAQRKAAQRDWMARQDPTAYTRLGNGAIVRVQPGIAPSYEEDQKEADMLGKCDQMVKDEYRKPNYVTPEGYLVGYRYGFFVFKKTLGQDMRDAETSNFHRAGRIRYVETFEIDQDCPFAVYTPHPAGDREYVTHMSLILCEVLDPRLAYMRHKRGEDKALERVMTAKRDVPNSPTLGDGLVTAVPGKAGIQYTGPTATAVGG